MIPKSNYVDENPSKLGGLKLYVLCKTFEFLVQFISYCNAAIGPKTLFTNPYIPIFSFHFSPLPKKALERDQLEQLALEFLFLFFRWVRLEVGLN